MSEDPTGQPGIGHAPGAPGQPEPPQPYGQPQFPHRRLPPPADQATRITRLARWSLWLGGLSLVLAIFLYPLGIVTGLISLILGIRAVNAARPYDFQARGATLGIVLGAIGLVLSLMITAVAIYLYPQISDYSKCQNEANTISDSNQCKDAFGLALEKKLHLKKGTINVRNMPSF